MASVAAKPASETMSNPPAFSYAQAARGETVAASTAAAPLDPSASTAPSNSPLGKDDSASTTNIAASAATSSVASDMQELPKALQESVDLSHPKNVDSEISSVVGSVASAGAAAGSRDDASSAAGSQSNEKPTGSSTSRPTDTPDARTARKGGKSNKRSDKSDGDQELNKENFKTFEPPAKVELSEAPIPTVNIWHQRSQELAKRASSAPTLSAAAIRTGSLSTAIVKATDAKKQAAAPEDLPENAATNKASAAGPSTKVTKKFSEPARPGSDSAPRRAAPRGSRVSAKDDRLPSSTAPPSVQDASLWPSIEPAADDGSKKPQDKTETERVKQEEAGSSKPRQKKGWAPLAVEHNTTYAPLDPHGPHQRHPRTRGGGRGGRESGTRGGHANAAGGPGTVPAEKETTPATFTTFTTKAVPAEAKDRPREGSTLPIRPTTQTPLPPKRGPSDPAAREAQRSGLPASEKPKGEHKGGEYGAPSVSARGEPSGQAVRLDFGANGDHAMNPRRQSSDRRDPRAPHDAPSDAGVSLAGRGEARSDRGRGSYRGRGGHSMAGLHQQQQPGFSGNGQRFMGGGMASQHHHQAPFSPTANPFVSGPGSGKRGAPRSQTGPSYGSGQRAPNGNIPAAGRMPSVPLPPTSMDFHPIQQPYQPYPAALSSHDDMIVTGLRAQIEYYFSFDNLLRDDYLRARMDSQGFVLLRTIAAFKRVTQLAPGFHFIQMACAQSHELDYVVGDDGEERLRSRSNIDQFIKAEFSHRAEEARTHGPAHVIYQNLDRQPVPYANGYGPHPSMYTTSPTNFHGEHLFANQNPMYPVNGAGHFGYGAINGAGMNGGGGYNSRDYVNGHHYPGESQLSATVPDFSPAQQRPSLETFQQLADADIPKLVVILGGGKEASATAAVNGLPPNGATSSAAEDRSPSEPAIANGVASKMVRSDSDAGQQPGGPVKSANAGTSKYPGFREHALGQRKLAAPGETPSAMHNLYTFWLDLLSNSFNAQLYEEFRQLALEDGAKQPRSPAGLRYLLAFYKNVFSLKRPYPQELDLHHQEAKAIVDSWPTGPNGVSHHQ